MAFATNGRNWERNGSTIVDSSLALQPIVPFHIITILLGMSFGHPILNEICATRCLAAPIPVQRPVGKPNHGRPHPHTSQKRAIHRGGGPSTATLAENYITKQIENRNRNDLQGLGKFTWRVQKRLRYPNKNPK